MNTISKRGILPARGVFQSHTRRARLPSKVTTYKSRRAGQRAADVERDSDTDSNATDSTEREDWDWIGAKGLKGSKVAISTPLPPPPSPTPAYNLSDWLENVCIDEDDVQILEHTTSTTILSTATALMSPTLKPRPTPQIPQFEEPDWFISSVNRMEDIDYENLEDEIAPVWPWSETDQISFVSAPPSVLFAQSFEFKDWPMNSVSHGDADESAKSTFESAEVINENIDEEGEVDADAEEPLKSTFEIAKSDDENIDDEEDANDDADESSESTFESAESDEESDCDSEEHFEYTSRSKKTKPTPRKTWKWTGSSASKPPVINTVPIILSSSIRVPEPPAIKSPPIINKSERNVEPPARLVSDEVFGEPMTFSNNSGHDDTEVEVAEVQLNKSRKKEKKPAKPTKKQIQAADLERRMALAGDVAAHQDKIRARRAIKNSKRTPGAALSLEKRRLKRRSRTPEQLAADRKIEKQKREAKRASMTAEQLAAQKQAKSDYMAGFSLLRRAKLSREEKDAENAEKYRKDKIRAERKSQVLTPLEMEAEEKKYRQYLVERTADMSPDERALFLPESRAIWKEEIEEDRKESLEKRLRGYNELPKPPPGLGADVESSVSILVLARFSSRVSDIGFAEANRRNQVVLHKFIQDFVPQQVLGSEAVVFNGRKAWAALPWAARGLDDEVVFPDDEYDNAVGDARYIRFLATRQRGSKLIILIRGVDGASIDPASWAFLRQRFPWLDIILVLQCTEEFVHHRTNAAQKYFWGQTNPFDGKLYAFFRLENLVNYLAGGDEDQKYFWLVNEWRVGHLARQALSAAKISADRVAITAAYRQFYFLYTAGRNNLPII